jgi:hypothetical protein
MSKNLLGVLGGNKTGFLTLPGADSLRTGTYQFRYRPRRIAAARIRFSCNGVSPAHDDSL